MYIDRGIYKICKYLMNQGMGLLREGKSDV